MAIGIPYSRQSVNQGAQLVCLFATLLCSWSHWQAAVRLSIRARCVGLRSAPSAIMARLYGMVGLYCAHLQSQLDVVLLQRRPVSWHMSLLQQPGLTCVHAIAV